jgi:hypothetical protein
LSQASGGITAGNITSWEDMAAYLQHVELARKWKAVKPAHIGKGKLIYFDTENAGDV